ncbi:hypothetical protein CYMTET_5247 [Cymbomonas tetramitiformis]|uniref:DUF2470 domain-containing protein n=1 Tax=Cymbomonas tetramitiformis TaxID=36881 RepID=A0AAE0GZW7_9CHLO|nr:hypothetical protein CYMTET_5247 [Cymbomonas tetramitiformis]
MLAIASFGTLCTVCEDSWPLGTKMNFVLDDAGQPILRLRKEALHTENLNRDTRCSLFVQPAAEPCSNVGRCTVIGTINDLDASEEETLMQKYLQVHGPGVGVDQIRSDDRYRRLTVERVFYVGTLGSTSDAEVISGEEYTNASPDILRSCAPDLVSYMDTECEEDLMRFCTLFAGLPATEIVGASLLWVDRQGFDVRAKLSSGEVTDVRLPFTKSVTGERDARSALNLMAQVAWELERNYQPTPPSPAVENEGASS